MPQPPSVDDAIRRKANLALGLSLGGLPICCAPLSIAGAIVGIQAMGLARSSSRPVPARAIVSMIVAALTTLMLVSAIIISRVKAKRTEDRLTVVQGQLEGKREAAKIDKATACALVEERLLADGFDGYKYDLADMRCDGELQAAADRASLHDVTFSFQEKSFKIGACFAHGPRWFVLDMRAGIDCKDVPMPPMPSGPASAPDIDEQERKARDALPSLGERTAARTFSDELVKVRGTIAGGTIAASTCAKTDFAKYAAGDERVKLDTIDYDLLDASASAPSGDKWRWLTSDRVRKILAEAKGGEPSGTPAMDRLKESGPFVLVYRAVEKNWPVVNEKEAFIGKKFAYTGGEFAGWMIVANLQTSKIQCAGKVGFENSDKLTYDKRGIRPEKDRALQAVLDDFKSQFEDATTKEIKALTGGGARLGYKIIE